jgi:putative aldouronate transport system permease protein
MADLIKDLRKLKKRKLVTDRNIVIKISKKTDTIINIVMIILCLTCLYPILTVFSVSITDEKTINLFGYHLIPRKISFSSYEFIFREAGNILRAYGVTIFVTVTGSLISLIIISLYAYPLSREDFKYRKLFIFLVFFTMLFNAGLVPWYMVYTNVLRIKNTIFALILPGLVTPLYVLIIRTFFITTIPEQIIEAAKIDGASEFRIFFQIILPVAKPSLATIGLFNVLYYWNDWYSPLLFITDEKLFNLQYMMYKIEQSINYLVTNIPQGIPLSEILKNIPAQSARMAMAMIAIGPVILAYPFFQRYFIAGLTIGSVKG